MFKLWLRAHWLEFKFNLLISKALRLRAKLIHNRRKLEKAVQELTEVNEDLRKTINESKSVHQARYPKVPPADTGGS
jgi:hypothetical protein